ncbi:hypothetical protein [Actinoplanes sp. G11-F43]|uniref:hypothetical protein n=1 Tax=Actinoplanes sp. G11-F43 TaxID=3424130 RepID=UPI003D343C77
MAKPELETPPDLAGQAFVTAVREKSRKLKQELIRQTLEDATSWSRAVNDKWADTHPGEWEGLPIPPAEVEEYRQRVRTEDYEWVEPSFERFLQPDPDALNPIIDALTTIEAMLEGSADANGGWTGASAALGRINDVRSDLNWWDGRFKDTFIDEFVTPLETSVPNQRELIRLTRDTMEGAKIINIRFRKSVLTMLDQGIAATQQLSNSACTGADVLKWGSIALCVVGTVAAATTGPGVALAGAVFIDVMGTIGGGLVPPDQAQTKLDLAAETATEVAAKITNAQSALGNDTSVAEEYVVLSLDKLHRILADGRRATLTSNVSGPFGVASPGLADATPGQITGGAFRPRR